MKDLEKYIKKLSTFKLVFFILVILIVFSLEITGIYMLYKEHLYYIILLFVVAELISSITINLVVGESIFNLNNLLLLIIISITVYLSYQNKQQNVERMTNLLNNDENLKNLVLKNDLQKNEDTKDVTENETPDLKGDSQTDLKGDLKGEEKEGFEGYDANDKSYGLVN